MVSKSKTKTNHDDQHEYERILRALGQEKAYGIDIDEGDDTKDAMIAIVAARKSVSVRIARTRLSLADALCRDDLAHWQRTSPHSTRRLILTQQGHAKIARLKAGDDSGAFQQQHRQMHLTQVADEHAPRALMTNIHESPLAWLAARRGKSGAPLVEASSLAAGERLRADVERAHMMPRITSNWSAAISTSRRGAGALDFSDASMAARQRVIAALKFVGPDFADVLLDVCAFLKGLEQVEHERHWPARSAKVVLKMALARLAVHYGYSTQAVGLAHSFGIQHWGAADYRPQMASDVGAG